MKRKTAMVLALVVTASLYGCGSSDIENQEAVDTYTAESFLFDCFFENDIATITIDGNSISGADAKGNEVFTHEYEYVEDIDAAYGEAVMPGYFHVYKTNDADAGDGVLKTLN